MRAWTLVAVLSSSLFACADPPTNPNPPAPPSSNDPAFSVDGLKDWYLMPDAVQPGTNQMTFIIKAPSGTDYVDAYLPVLGGKRMHSQSGGYALDLDITSIPVGTHDILFTADGSTTAFAKATFHRTMPYYVLVSTDYDFSDPGDTAMQHMNELHTNHPGMKITHFWAPYTYTDTAVTAARADALTTWIKKQRDDFHDEIGLHIHPYCNFVNTTSVPCNTTASTVYPAGDTSGYTIKLAAYTRAEMGTLLQRAAEIFGQQGLGTPTSFRAGGWTADKTTLQALDDNGYVADTSALNWARIEEWNGKELYTWNQTNWSTIGDTSQPYYPSADDPQSSGASDLSMLEVPDNGVMIDYVSLTEMTGLFDANWNGEPLAAPKTLMMGFHPAIGFSSSEYGRVEGFLKYSDMHLGSDGTGPVVYTTLSQVSAVFPP